MQILYWLPSHINGIRSAYLSSSHSRSHHKVYAVTQVRSLRWPLWSAGNVIRVFYWNSKDWCWLRRRSSHIQPQWTDPCFRKSNTHPKSPYRPTKVASKLESASATESSLRIEHGWCFWPSIWAVGQLGWVIRWWGAWFKWFGSACEGWQK